MKNNKHRKKNREKKRREKVHFENVRLASYKIHNSFDLPKFYNILVKPQTQNDARRTFFKR